MSINKLLTTIILPYFSVAANADLKVRKYQISFKWLIREIRKSDPEVIEAIRSNRAFWNNLIFAEQLNAQKDIAHGFDGDFFSTLQVL